MDNNDFSFDELLKNCSFVPYESKATILSYDELHKFLKENIADNDVTEEIESLASDHGCKNFDDGFKQGFCFAVKSIKFLMKI